MPAHDPVVNPSIHYLGVEGSTSQQDHAQCIAQNARIMAERSDTYGDEGAYNFQLCNSHGIRFEGRGWGRDSAANGIGDYDGVDYNVGSRAMCVLVGTDDEITDAAIAGIRAFANEAVHDHGMQRPLRGHSEFVATSCPGDHLRSVIDVVNAHHDAPAPAPAPTGGHDNMDMLVGKFAKPTSWISPEGAIPIPGGQPVALLVQGNVIIGSWGGPAPFGIPGPAAAWRDANGTRSSIDVTLVEPSMLAGVVVAHNKLLA